MLLQDSDRILMMWLELDAVRDSRHQRIPVKKIHTHRKFSDERSSDAQISQSSRTINQGKKENSEREVAFSSESHLSLRSLSYLFYKEVEQ